jgi:hypothetical protein
MAERELLGAAACPLCGNKAAKVKLSGTSHLAYLHCNGCSCQIFARSGTSDEKLRALIAAPANERSAPAPKPAAKAEPKPAAAAPKEKAKAPALVDEWDPFG